MSLRYVPSFGLLLSSLWFSIYALAQPSELPSLHEYSHGIPPRYQWNANNGYCGEVSFISAGLHFGQYCSQFTARKLASPDVPQSDASSQLLLGVNDSFAAERMRLRATEFYYPTQRTTTHFLAWVKSQTLSGHVVILGVFNNGILLEEWTGRDDGDAEYDHIVPVLRWGSRYSFEKFGAQYYPSDVVTISDNGLYGPNDPSNCQYFYSYHLRNFVGNRRQANAPRGPLYLLKNKPANYGIAIEGVLDLDHLTVPVTLAASLNYEPGMASGSSDIPPPPVPLTLTATVTLSDPTKAHVLYRYDDFDKVPVANFNAAANDASESWQIPPGSGTHFQVVVQTTTNATVVFRAVPSDAP